MRNNWERFESLASQAALDGPPPIDVAARVADQIRRRSTTAPAASSIAWELAGCATLGLAAAALAAGLPAFRYELNPFIDFLEPIALLLG